MGNNLDLNKTFVKYIVSKTSPIITKRNTKPVNSSLYSLLLNKFCIDNPYKCKI